MAYVHIIGRLTADPVQKDVSGATCTTFTVAEDTRRKDKDGNKVTNFWRVTAWRGLGDTVAKYLHKGNQVYVVGNEVLVNTYTDKNGQWRSSLETTAADMRFVGSKNDNAGTQDEAPPAPPASAPMPADGEDDLPFE